MRLYTIKQPVLRTCKTLFWVFVIVASTIISIGASEVDTETISELEAEVMEITAGSEVQKGLAVSIFKEISLPRDAVVTYETIVDNKLYYTSNIEGHIWLCCLDLESQRTDQVVDLTKQMVWDETKVLEEIKEINGSLYMVIRYFDERSFSMERYQQLYLIEEQRVTPLAEAKYFGSIIAEDDVLYYIDTGEIPFGLGFYGSLNKLDLKLRKYIEIKNDQDERHLYNFLYDIILTKQDDGMFIDSAKGLQSKGDYLYVQAGLYTKVDDNPAILEEEGIYRIYKKTGEHEKLTDAAIQFWIIGDELYYIDGKSGYLIKSDLDGQKKQQLISSPIKYIAVKDNVFYYSIRSNKNKGSGLYVYNPEKGFSLRVSMDSMKDLEDIEDLIVNNQGVYYMKNHTLYKIEDEKSKPVTEDIKEYMAASDYIIYRTLKQEILYVVQ